MDRVIEERSPRNEGATVGRIMSFYYQFYSCHTVSKVLYVHCVLRHVTN
jgi:hypothetical protein